MSSYRYYSPQAKMRHALKRALPYDHQWERSEWLGEDLCRLCGSRRTDSPECPGPTSTAKTWPLGLRTIDGYIQQ